MLGSWWRHGLQGICGSQGARSRKLACFKDLTFLLACLQGKHALELFLFFVKGRISRNGPGPGAIEASCLSLLLDAISNGPSKGPCTDEADQAKRYKEKEKMLNRRWMSLVNENIFRTRSPGNQSSWKPMYSEADRSLCEFIELSSLPLLPQIALD